MNLLEIKNVTKEYTGTTALKSVSLTFEGGKVNALIGKNGSGKSTLVKMLSGAITPTQGQLFLNGEEIRFSSPSEAFEKGIATVYQELSLISQLTVAENILMGRLPKKGRLIDWGRAFEIAKDYLDSMNVDISPKALVSDLSVWQCQIIEILKAMSYNPKVLLLDEPTSSLAVNEARKLFDFIRTLIQKDVIVIFITHRLQELWEVADTCSVLRDGDFIGSMNMKDASHNTIIKMMFGDVKINCRKTGALVSDEIVLRVETLTKEKKFYDVSFELKKGEILGIAGMLGSGRTELLRAIFGADTFDSGQIFINGRQIKKTTPIKMKKNGLALAPEDRKLQGLNQKMSVKQNLTLSALDRISKGLFISKATEKEFVGRQIENLQIKVPDVDFPVSSLSGGNQQKVVVGNWLNSSPKIMFYDEPSRGIDVNAKQQIFQIIWDQSQKGISSVMVSSEFEELLEVCHRILIMRNGRIVGEINSDVLELNELYLLCMGGTKNATENI